MKALLICAIAVGAGLTFAEPGNACSRPVSITPLEPRALVTDADAAFIGTLVAVRPKEAAATSSGAPHIFTYAVEEHIKGDLGKQVELTSSLGSALCGLDGTIGRRAAFLLRRSEGAWGPWALEEVDAATLRRGLLPLPKPDGVGPAAFMAGGHFGVARSAILDSHGRTLTYGWGRGVVTDLSICPGAKVVVELVRSRESVAFAVRRIPSLRLVRQMEIAVVGYGQSVVCRNRFASDVLASVSIFGPSQSETQLLRITPVGTRILERASRLALAAHGDWAFVSLADGSLVARNLVTGARLTVARTGQSLTGMSVSPDRRFLTGFTSERLVLVDLLRRTTRAQRWAGVRSDTEWVAPRTFTAWSSGPRGRLELFDQALRRVRPAMEWVAYTTTSSSAGAFGVAWSGELLRERNGYIVRLGQLFSPAVSVLAPLKLP